MKYSLQVAILSWNVLNFSDPSGIFLQQFQQSTDTLINIFLRLLHLLYRSIGCWLGIVVMISSCYSIKHSFQLDLCRKTGHRLWNRLDLVCSWLILYRLRFILRQFGIKLWLLRGGLQLSSINYQYLISNISERKGKIEIGYRRILLILKHFRHWFSLPKELKFFKANIRPPAINPSQ